MICTLFDLDGTLVSTGGAGIRALDKSVHLTHGVVNASRGVKAAGKTDPAIIREIFRKRFGRDCTKNEMSFVQKNYLRYLRFECEHSPDYKVFDGVTELLVALRRSGILMGLGTGNIQEGARIKLKRARLNRFFPFGGFGSDHEDRIRLLKIALTKARRFSRRNIKPEEVFVVGDTVRDIRAARAAGFKVIAVGTGSTAESVLRKCKPDLYLSSLRDREKFFWALKNAK